CDQLGDIPREARRMTGMTADVYLLFPNANLAVLSNHTQLTIMEPISPSETHSIVYRVRNLDANGEPVDLEAAKRDALFVKDFGIEEDREAARIIQAGISSKANSHFTFGHYEKAIVHFHQNLTGQLERS